MGRRASGLVVMALLAMSSSAAATPLVDGKVQVFLEQRSTHAPLDGYIPIPLTAKNLDGRRHTVTVKYTSQPYSTVTRSAELEPGETRTLMLYAPAASRYGQVSADSDVGIDQRSESLSWGYDSLPSTLAEGARESVAEQLPGLKEDLDNTGAQRPLVRLAHDQLPDQLIGYVGFSGVAIVDTPFEELPEPQRRALEAYAATGGNLLLVRPPARLETYLPLAGDTASPVRPYGFGRLYLCSSRREGCGAVTKGFIGDTAVMSRPTVAENEIENNYRRGPGSVNDLLLEVARVPVGSFVLIVLLFAAVIGPGSFMMRRRYGPQALLGFIPGTAMVTCLGIAAYGGLHEGLFTVHAASIAMTVLDEPQHRQVTVAVDGFYASMAPRRVRFPGMQAVLLGDSRSLASRGIDLDLSSDLSFGSGLVPSRSYREYVVTAVQPSRARLVAKSSGAETTVENALGGKVVRGLLRTNGQWCTFTDVADNERAKATCTTNPLLGPEVASPGNLREALKRRFKSESLLGGPLAELKDGEFIAQLETAVFAPTGELNLERKGDVQVVRGRVSP